MPPRPTEARSIVPSTNSGFSTAGVRLPGRLLGALAGATLAAEASASVINASFDSGFTDNGAVSDGLLAGWSDTRSLAASGTLTAVTVSLSISGGYNGDLYAYLAHGSVSVPLLNRVGITDGDSFGYDDAGLTVAFADTATHGDIHFYRLVTGYETAIAGGGLFEPDGRDLPPTTGDPSAFDAAERLTLGAFVGANASGPWTLFVADVSGGGGTSTVNSWGLQLTTVPEPTTSATVTLLLAAGTAIATNVRRPFRPR